LMRIIFTLISIIFIAVPAAPLPVYQSNQAPASILITGVMLIDGSGAPARRADVRIAGDKIAEVGSLQPKAGEGVIEERGMTVAPGFIDIHNHSESGLNQDPTARSQILQGITTLAIGPDGASPYPTGKYLAVCEARHAAVNLLAFIGHATARLQV